MTNFEHYTQSVQRLADLLYMAVNDALMAEGCSIKLKYPEQLSGAEEDRIVTWDSFLEEEYIG